MNGFLAFVLVIWLGCLVSDLAGDVKDY